MVKQKQREVNERLAGELVEQFKRYWSLKGLPKENPERRKEARELFRRLCIFCNCYEMGERR